MFGSAAEADVAFVHATTAPSQSQIASTKERIFYGDQAVLKYLEDNFPDLLLHYSKVHPEVQGDPVWQVAESLTEDIMMHHTTKNSQAKMSARDAFMKRLEKSLDDLEKT